MADFTKKNLARCQNPRSHPPKKKHFSTGIGLPVFFYIKKY
jgi:hypothetical protein